MTQYLARCARMLGAVSLLLTSFAVAGCGNARPTAHVKGTVTIDGEPVHKGRISFRSNGPNVQLFSTEIHSGEFSGEAIVGKNTVEVLAFQPASKEEFESLGVKERNVVPDKYNVKSELKADVTSGANRLGFELKVKP